MKRFVLLATVTVALLPTLGVASSASATTTFVTATGMTGIRFCYFAGLNSPGGTEQPASCRDTHNAAAMSRVVTELNQLADINPNGAYSCPADRGQEVRLVVAYRDVHRERVDVQLSGCSFATHPPRTAKHTTDALRKDLASRSGYRGTAT